MSVLLTRETTFADLVARYERAGWTIRLADRQALRAFVLRDAPGADAGADEGAPPVAAPTHWPACRKLWIDAEGRPIETDVPC